MKITVLCENSIGKLVGFGEHGFSASLKRTMETTSSTREPAMPSLPTPLP